MGQRMQATAAEGEATTCSNSCSLVVYAAAATANAAAVAALLLDAYKDNGR